MESIATRVTPDKTRSTGHSTETEYSTGLNRALSVSDLIAYGMVYMLPISPFAMYGIIASVSNGMVPLIYILSVVAMAFTARSYQVLSKEFPNAGSAYTYARHGIGEFAGFFAGWLLFLDYIISPGLLAIISAAAMSSFVPEVPRWCWILGFIAIGTMLNLVGVSVTAKTNRVFLVIMVAVLAVFLGAGLFALYSGKGNGGLTLTALYNPHTFTWAAAGSGILVASLNFLGFDAITTLGEEVKPQQKHLLGFAGMATLAIMAVLFVGQTWVAADLAPGAHILSPDTAFYDISRYAGGSWLSGLTAIGTALAFGIPCTIVSQLAIARIIYAMGRDRQLPHVFARVSTKSQQPYVANLFVAAVSLVVSLAFQDHLDELALFQNFGALSAFMLVNISLIGYFWFKKGSRNLLSHMVLPLVGLGIIIALMSSMRIPTLQMGATWLAIGLAYFLFMRFALGRKVAIDV
ncbi:APC family permease [Paraburkholderia bannensis]|uniref:APC family permease n=1 Tax=Paraburkholderia bannensis TaxID=765414 RepID=UPI002AC34827|nr:APC family permease [Paraburkholderia bannensis]